MKYVKNARTRFAKNAFELRTKTKLRYNEESLTTETKE